MHEYVTNPSRMDILKRIYCRRNEVQGVNAMYKKQEKYLMWLAFVVAGIMLLSFVGRIFGS